MATAEPEKLRTLFDAEAVTPPTLSGLITFMELDSEKYVVAMSAGCDQGSDKACHGSVYYFPGTARVSYPLEWVTFRHDADGITPLLSNRSDTTGLSDPRIFVVQLSDLRLEDFKVIEDVEPDGLSAGEAGAIGAIVGVVGGGVAGYAAGNVVGGAAEAASAFNGLTLFSPISRVFPAIGGGAGSTLGEVGGGFAGYLIGQHYLTGLHIMDGGSEAQSQNVFEQAQRMAVAELLSDTELMKRLETAARDHVDQLVRDLGLARAKPAMIA